MRKAYTLLILFFLLNVPAWLVAKNSLAGWINVPPPPSAHALGMGTLGDPEMAYRVNGYLLQNLGDHGGKTRNLSEYDYKKLTEWLYVLDELNQKSQYLPTLAAYYYGAVKSSEDISLLTQYLVRAGSRDYAGKWRWLHTALVYQKNRVGDVDRALELAYRLEETDYPDKPGWASRLVPMLYLDKEDRRQAYLEALRILVDRRISLPFSERKTLVDLVCIQLKEFSAQDPICLF